MNAIPADATEPRRTVLVVDDAPMFREIETVFLARMANVITANDGTDALAVLQREPADLVITDLSMREMDGDELCRRIRRDPDLRRLPVVLVTSGRSAEEHERAVRAGANDVIEKPLNRVSLLQVANRFLRLTERGLERAALETEVYLSGPLEGGWAWSRNVSRGGIYVEADTALVPDSEISIEFQLPETKVLVAPTARVAWRQPPDANGRAGMGLQFLKLDRQTARWLDQYVYERGAPIGEPRAPGAR